MLIGNNPSANGGYNDSDPLFSVVNFSVKDQVAANERAKNLAISWIKENPVDFFKLLPLKAWKLWAVDGESEWLYQRGLKSYEDKKIIFRTIRFLNQIYYSLAIFIVVAICPYYLFKAYQKSSIYLILGYLVFTYITLISLCFFGSPRFHFPAMPFVFLYCAWVLENRIFTQIEIIRDRPIISQVEQRGHLM